MATGIEVAGLILAVIPLLLPLLDDYKDGMRRTAVFFRRKKHVEKLAKALTTQRILLSENVRTLLLRIEVDDIPDQDIYLFNLLQTAGVKQRLQEYLGNEAHYSYMEAVGQTEAVIRRLIRNIEGFLPVLSFVNAGFQNQQDDILAIIEANEAAPNGQLALLKRAKLTLNYQDVEKSINELDSSVVLLERLYQAVAERREAAVHSTDRRAAKLASSLHAAREHAISLFNALVSGLRPGCHQAHEARIYLDGTRPFSAQNDRRSISFPKRSPYRFRVIFSSPDNTTTAYWYENTIEVLEDDGTTQYSTPRPTSVSAKPVGLQVTLFPPISISPGGTISLSDVDNLCITLNQAARDKKLLKLYLASQQKMRCKHEACASYSTPQQCPSVSLEELLNPPLQAVKPVKMGLKNRMLLALNLASTLLQLQNTPWLTKSWSKKAIQFLQRPVGSPQAAPTTTTNAATTRLQIDFRQPLISQKFSGTAQNTAHMQAHLGPKEALLELGIMLLELWHETSLETRFAGTPIPDDYWGRFRLAMMWLEDPEDQPLPLYHTAVSQCVKCFFGGTFASPSWENPEFRKALCKDMVEPLHESCRPWL